MGRKNRAMLQRDKQKNKGYGWLAIVLAGALIYAFNQSEQPSSVSYDEDLSNAEGAQKLYALNAGDYHWPAAGNAPISTNLLAKNYYLVFDGSGSMSEKDCGDGQTKLAVAKKAFKAFVDQLPADANVGLYVFDEHAMDERVTLGVGNRDQINSTVRKVKAGGGTPLSSAIEKGYASLTAQAQAQLGYGEYHLVVITDGMASQGYEPGSDVQQILESSPVNIHTIGFCLDEYHSLNQQGLTYYRAASDAKGLAEGLSDVLAEAPDFTVIEFGK